jgi:hypothetical protein
VPESAFHPKSQGRPTAGEAPATSRAVWLLFAVAGLTFAVGARLSRDSDLSRGEPSALRAIGALPAGPTASAPLAPSASANDGSRPSAAPTTQLSAAAALTDPSLPQDGPLRPDDNVPPGHGLLEVTAGPKESIYLDGALLGTGPLAKRVLAPRPDPYEIRVTSNGDPRTRYALVKEGRLTQVRMSPPWSR